MVRSRVLVASENAGVRGALSAEAPVTFVVNDHELATLLCTPHDLHDLAVGWLFAEGLIDSPREVVSLAGCANDREMLIRTALERPTTLGERWRLVTSGCGGAANPGALRAEDVPKVGDGLRLSVSRLRELASAMLRATALYRQTGGVHAAALATAQSLVVVREDIGRHNAVDKAIGHALRSGTSLDGLLLLSTGRLSSEMVWKAARAGLQLAASVSIPSTLARDLAEAAGLTLVGRVVSSQPTIYTRPDRLAAE